MKLARFFTLLCACPLVFADSTWNIDADGIWDTPTNWTPVGVPNGNTAIVNFGNIITAPRNIVLNNDFTVGTITFDNANGYSLTNNKLLTINPLGPSSALGSITITNTNGNGAHTIDNMITSNRPIVITQGSTQPFTLSNNINISGPLIINGQGAVEISGNTSNTSCSITLNSGQVILNKTPPAVAVNSNIVVNNGTLTLAATGQISQVFTTTTINGGTFDLAGNSVTLNRLNYLGGTITLGNATLSLTSSSNCLTMRNTTLTGGTISLTGNTGSVAFDASSGGSSAILSNINLNNTSHIFIIDDSPSAPVDMSIQGVISGVSGGNLSKRGAGTLELAGNQNNIYAGTTNVLEGTLVLNKSSAIAIPANIIISGGALRLEQAGQFSSAVNLNLGSGTFDMQGFATPLNSFTWSGGDLVNPAGTLTLTAPSNALSLYGGITLNPDIALSSSGTIFFLSSNPGNAIINGNIDLGGGNVVIFTTPGISSQSLIITGTISNGSINKVDLGTLTLQGTNTYSGGTTVTSGILQGNTKGLQGNINNNATLLFIENSSGSYTGALNGNGTVNFQGTGTITFSGALNNNNTGAKNISSGTLILARTSPAVALSGPVNVAGGSVILQANNQFNPTQTNLTLQSGIFNINSFNATLNSFNFSSGTFLGSNGTLTLAGSSNALIADGGSINAAVVLTGASAPQVVKNVSNATSINSVTATTANATPTFTINGSAVLTVNDSGANNAGFIKNGVGNLIFGSGLHNYPLGNSALQAGSLSVNGTLSTATLDVAAGAVLKGIGVINADVTLQGILQPGQSIGTLQINGSQVFASSSIYEVEVDATSTDQLIVTGAPGTVVINPGATISFFSSTSQFPANTTFTLINASGGLSGQFSNVVVNGAPILNNLTLTYTANALLLGFQTMSFSTIVTGNSNAAQVAQVLDQLNPAPGSDLAYVISVLQDAPSESELVQELNAIQPSMLKALAIAEENAAIRSSLMITQRIEQIITRTCVKNIVGKQISLWSNLMGDGMHQHSIGEQVGFMAKTGGFALGADYQDPRQFFVGTALNYDYTKVCYQQHAGTGSINSGIMSLYGGWYGQHMFADMVLQGAFNHYQEKRNINFSTIDRKARANFNGGEFLLRLDLGTLWNAFSVEWKPFIATNFMYLHQQAFRETGAASLDLYVHSSNYTFIRSEAGLRVAHCFGLPRYNVRLGALASYVREDRLQGKRYKAGLYGTDPYFIVQGMSPDRDLFASGLSVSILSLDGRYQASFDYEAEIGHNYWDQNGRALFSYRF